MSNLTFNQRLVVIHGLLTALGSLDDWNTRIQKALIESELPVARFLAGAPFAVLFLLTLVADQAQEIQRLKALQRAEVGR